MASTQRVALHPRTIKTLPAPDTGRIEYWDTGCEGLVLRVTARGARSYSVRYRFDGKQQRYSLGRAEKVALTDARDGARKALTKVSHGEDPQAAKIEKRREAQRAHTFGELADEYMAAAILRPNTRRQWKGIIERRLKPAFGKRRPGEILRPEIRDFVRDVSEDVPVLAARCFEVMRRVFSWAVSEEKLPASPFVALKKPDKVQKADARERERVLTHAEIRRVFDTLNGETYAATDLGDYLTLLFLTAARREELLKAAWQEIDFGAKVWTIPAERYKSGTSHQIPLSTTALRTIQSLRERNPDSPFVFPGKDRQKARESPQRAFETFRRTVGFVDWRLHDIRRTVRTELARLAVLPHVAEAILGHTPDKLTRTYQHYKPLPEMEQALERWAVKLDQIAAARPGAQLLSFPQRA